MSANIGVTLSTTKLEVAAGASVETAISIKNQSQIVDQFVIKVEGIEPMWWSLSVSSVSLFPGDQDQTKLTIRPPKEAEAKAGSYPFQIKVISQANTQEVTTADAFLVIRGFSAWEADISPSKVTGYSGTYKIKITNSGNADINVNFEARDPEEALYYKFSNDQISIPAGDSVITQLTVRPKKGENKKLYNFQVISRPSGGSITRSAKTLNGQLEYKKPRKFPWWIIPIVILLLVAAYFLFLSQGFTPPRIREVPFTPQHTEEIPPEVPHPPPESEAGVNIISPRGGESWIAGTTVEIAWEAGGSGMEWFNLHYSTDGGKSWRLIWGGPYNDSSSPRPWKVPFENSNNCFVKVMFLNPEGKTIAQDINKAPFSIHSK